MGVAVQVHHGSSIWRSLLQNDISRCRRGDIYAPARDTQASVPAQEHPET